MTTDDSASAPEATSRNDGINREHLSNIRLPTITQLAEAAAILRAVPAGAGATPRQSEPGKVSLWALDLSDAYRQIAAAREDWWLQSFVWHDGVRLDKRCVFGSAHLVDFFQRLSSFVLAVATGGEYDASRRVTQTTASGGESGKHTGNVEG